MKTYKQQLIVGAILFCLVFLMMQFSSCASENEEDKAAATPDGAVYKYTVFCEGECNFTYTDLDCMCEKSFNGLKAGEKDIEFKRTNPPMFTELKVKVTETQTDQGWRKSVTLYKDGELVHRENSIMTVLEAFFTI